MYGLPYAREAFLFLRMGDWPLAEWHEESAFLLLLSWRVNVAIISVTPSHRSTCASRRPCVTHSLYSWVFRIYPSFSENLPGYLYEYQPEKSTRRLTQAYECFCATIRYVSLTLWWRLLNISGIKVFSIFIRNMPEYSEYTRVIWIIYPGSRVPLYVYEYQPEATYGDISLLDFEGWSDSICNANIYLLVKFTR